MDPKYKIQLKIISALAVIHGIIHLLFRGSFYRLTPIQQSLYILNFLWFITLTCTVVICLAKKNATPKKNSHIDEDDPSIHDYDLVIKEYFPNIKGEKELLDNLYNRFINVEKFFLKEN